MYRELWEFLSYASTFCLLAEGQSLAQSEKSSSVSYGKDLFRALRRLHDEKNLGERLRPPGIGYNPERSELIMTVEAIDKLMIDAAQHKGERNRKTAHDRNSLRAFDPGKEFMTGIVRLAADPSKSRWFKCEEDIQLTDRTSLRVSFSFGGILLACAQKGKTGLRHFCIADNPDFVQQFRDAAKVCTKLPLKSRKFLMEEFPSHKQFEALGLDKDPPGLSASVWEAVKLFEQTPAALAGALSHQERVALNCVARYIDRVPYSEPDAETVCHEILLLALELGNPVPGATLSVRDEHLLRATNGELKLFEQNPAGLEEMVLQEERIALETEGYPMRAARLSVRDERLLRTTKGEVAAAIRYILRVRG